MLYFVYFLFFFYFFFVFVHMLHTHTHRSNTSPFPPGIPKIMALSRTHKTQILSSTQDSLIFKLQQEYKPKGSPAGKKVNSLVTLTLDEEGKVRYHKDMWNEKDYSHGGVGMLLKRWNGDYLTGVTRPPKELGPEE